MDIGVVVIGILAFLSIVVGVALYLLKTGAKYAIMDKELTEALKEAEKDAKIEELLTDKSKPNTVERLQDGTF